MQIPVRFLNHPFECTCGKTHYVPIEKIEVGQNVADHLVAYLKDEGLNRVLVVADNHSWSAHGEAVYQSLVAGGMECEVCVLKDSGHGLLPDEHAIAGVSDIMRRFQPVTAIAVGSGVINDVVRFTTFEAGLPYIVMATAPSMDGYASTVAAMQFAGVKTTLPAHSPKAIFADAEVLSDAPWELIQAGFGDLLGKVTSLLDWKLAHALYGEYFCDASYQIVLEPLRYCIENAEALVKRQKEAVSQLFFGLINAGIAMAMVENSRPCSGCEHHCSHFWDLLAFKGQREHTSHGLQVGYATHWTIRFYEYMRQLGQISSIEPMVLTNEWMDYVQAFYGDGSEEVKNAQRAKQSWLSAHASATTGKTFAEVLAALDPEISFAPLARAALTTMGISDHVDFLGLSRSQLEMTFRHARELRARYTVFDFLVGQNQLEHAIQHVLSSTTFCE